MIEYYVELIGRNDIGAYISLAMLAFVIVLSLFGALKGATRGIGRQGVRLVTVAVSAVLAYYATRSCYPMLVGFCEGKTMMELLRTFRLDGFITGLSAQIADLVTAMDAATAADVLTLPITVVLLPFFFVVLFFLISAVMMLVHVCVSGMLGYAKNNNNGLTRVLGAILGLVQGALVAALILVPVSGLINVAAEASDRSKTEEGAATILYQTYFEEAANSPVHQLVSECGGEMLYEKITTVTLVGEEEPIDTREPTYHLFIIYDKWMSMGEEVDFTDLNEEQKASMREIVSIAGEDPYIARVLSGVVRTMMKSELIKGELVDNFDEPFRSFFVEWLTIFETCTPETLGEDLSCVVDVMFIMMDHGVFRAFAAEDGELMRSIFITEDSEGQTVITKIVDRFNQNPRTTALVTSIARLSLTLMAGGNDLGLTAQTLETFNAVKDGLTEGVLSLDKASYGEDTDAYVADVAAALDATLTENGIALDPEIVDGMAQYISEQDDTISALDEMDDATLNDIIISYYAAYIQTLQ